MSPTEGSAMRQEVLRLNANSAQVLRFFDYCHLIEPGGGIPDVPFSRKERGKWRPPVSESLHDLMEVNRESTRYVRPLLTGRGSVARWPEEVHGWPPWRVISDALFFPTAINTWRDGRTEADRIRLRALKQLCGMVAARLPARRDSGAAFVLNVVTDPREAARLVAVAAEESGSPRDPDAFKKPDARFTDPRRAPAGRGRSFTAQDSYRQIVGDMERMVLEGAHEKEEAKTCKADRLGCSKRRIEAAITFVNSERLTVFDRSRMLDERDRDAATASATCA